LTSSSSAAELASSLNPSAAPPPEWRQEANHRLAAHRARRKGFVGLQSALPGMEEQASDAQPSRPRTKTVAARVAERYAQAPSYSEMLAAEARNAARAAEAAAAAASEAREAAQAILIGLDVELNEGTNDEGWTVSTASLRDSQATLPSAPGDLSPQPLRPHLAVVEAELDENFDDEPIAPVQPLAAKLLEFPRELVAARKARPRLAEGPLRDEHDREALQSQLRIFEVEVEAISTEAGVDPVLSGWSAIRLDSQPTAHLAASSHRQDSEQQRIPPGNAPAGAPDDLPAFDLPLQPASLEDRMMAGTVDAALTVGGFLIFVLVFAACTAHLPGGKLASIGAAVALFAFAVIYQLLFFCLGHDTPGMRYAKIALCTFDDENPTRQTVQRRLAALLLAICPLGLGILWAFFDDDRLGWHDRISRTYQRSYR
jgi:uncharacterized RDD family membrane protein YckC